MADTQGFTLKPQARPGPICQAHITQGLQAFCRWETVKGQETEEGSLGLVRNLPVLEAQRLVYALTFCSHAGGPLAGEGPEAAGLAIATDWRWGHRVEHGVSEEGMGTLQEGKGDLQVITEGGKQGRSDN